MTTMEGTRWDDPIHFDDVTGFRAWLAENHASADELWVGFYRKATGKGGLQYKEAVDECLCWGWIDGIRKKVDDERYVNRVTPRKRKSKWSQVNVDRYEELDTEGRIAEPGRVARARFDASEHEPYSFETAPKELPPEFLERFQANEDAWTFFRAQPPSYRKTARFWVMSAKRDSTRDRRLDKLIRFSAAGERLPEVAGGATRDEP